MPLLREGVRLHFKLYLMPLPSPRSGFVQPRDLRLRKHGYPTDYINIDSLGQRCFGHFNSFSFFPFL
uniref:Uncharacterized protein n=2 Tax=Candidatus Kentrum sp. MB TaxID=2138164 RepID=A0A450Y1Q8_9GAMM|nr:MAG: hypothetical protein BECKMB1821I_GA0114274_11201 [Candidatus Kentron sp. MB]